MFVYIKDSKFIVFGQVVFFSFCLFFERIFCCVCLFCCFEILCVFVVSEVQSIRVGSILYSFDVVCASVCMPMRLYCEERKVMAHNEFSLLKNRHCEFGCGSVYCVYVCACERACVGVVKGIMTAAYAHVSLYCCVCVSECL